MDCALHDRFMLRSHSCLCSCLRFAFTDQMKAERFERRERRRRNVQFAEGEPLLSADSIQGADLTEVVMALEIIESELNLLRSKFRGVETKRVMT